MIIGIGKFRASFSDIRQTSGLNRATNGPQMFLAQDDETLIFLI